MNTTKYGMRALLASAAAGALVLGSAAGVMAEEAPTPTVPTAPVAQVVKLQKVDIHRHSPINVTKPRALKVRMVVRTSGLPAESPAPQAVVTLAQYTKKVKGTAVSPAAVAPITVPTMTGTPDASKTTWTFKGEIAKEVFGALALPAGSSALLCVSTVKLDPPATVYSMQTERRLGVLADGTPSTKKAVRECVKVFNPKAKPAKPAKS